MFPIAAIGLAVLAAVMLASSKAKASEAREPFFRSGKRDLVSRLSKDGPPLVSFTEVKVPWRRSRKTGQILARKKIAESPREILAKVSRAVGREIDLDALILATMISSEVGDRRGREHPIAKAAIGHAALTEARLRSRSLSQQVIPDGFFGDQLGRYASTRKPPTAADIEMAEAILSGRVGTPTPGATNWDSPEGQRAAIKAQIPGYEGQTPDVVAMKREKAGKEPIYVPGVDPDYLRLWRPKTAA